MSGQDNLEFNQATNMRAIHIHPLETVNPAAGGNPRDVSAPGDVSAHSCPPWCQRALSRGGRGWAVIVLLALVSLLIAVRAEGQITNGSFSLVRRELALPVQRPGMFVGQSDGALMVGGGLDANGRPSGEVFVQSAGEWKKFELKVPVAFAGFANSTVAAKGGAVSKLLVVGGLTEDGLTGRVQALEWNGTDLIQSELPPLPQALALAGVGVLEDQAQKQVYVMGGTPSIQADVVSDRLFRLTLNGEGEPAWEELPPVPGEGRLLPGVICFYNDVHLFGGFTVSKSGGQTVYAPTARAQAYRWHYIDGTTFDGWRELTPLPQPVAAPVVFMTGQVHAGLAGGFTNPIEGTLLADHHTTAGSKLIQIYHNVTDTWVEKGALPEALAEAVAVRSNGRLTLVGTTESGARAAYGVSIRRTVKSLGLWDYLGLLGFFAVVAVAGIWFTRKQSSSAAFAPDRNLRTVLAPWPQSAAQTSRSDPAASPGPNSQTPPSASWDWCRCASCRCSSLPDRACRIPNAPSTPPPSPFPAIALAIASAIRSAPTSLRASDNL